MVSKMSINVLLLFMIHLCTEYVVSSGVQKSSIECKSVTSFDGYCLFPNGDLVLATLKPCTYDRPLAYFVLITTDETESYTLHETKVETQKFGNYTIEVSLEILRKDMADVYEVTLDMTDKIDHKLQVFNFPINKNDCYHGEMDKELVKPSGRSGQIAIGEFSTFFLLPSMTKLMVYFDPCTVPFSYTIQMIKSKEQKIYRFTETMNKTLLPLLGNSNEGLHLYLENKIMYLENVYSPEYHSLQVVYFKKPGGAPTTIIDTIHSTHFGLICPQHSCSLVKGDRLHQKCYAPWIDFGGSAERTARVDIQMEPPCSYPMKAVVDIDIMNDDEFLFRDPVTLTAYHENDWRVESNTEELHLGLPATIGGKRDFPGDGYMSLDYGRFSLYIKEDQHRQKKGAHVLILRHYPTLSNVIPIFNMYFDGFNTKYCPKDHFDGSENNRAIIIGFVSSFAVLGILLIFIVCMRRRARLIRMHGLRKDAGLPHQIQLDDGNDWL